MHSPWEFSLSGGSGGRTYVANPWSSPRSGPGFVDNGASSGPGTPQGVMGAQPQQMNPAAIQALIAQLRGGGGMPTPYGVPNQGQPAPVPQAAQPAPGPGPAPTPVPPPVIPRQPIMGNVGRTPAGRRLIQ